MEKKTQNEIYQSTIKIVKYIKIRQIAITLTGFQYFCK